MTRSYMVVYERVAEDNWGGWAQDIGGAVGAGNSLAAARQSLREGIEIMLEDLAERGLPAPMAASTTIDLSEYEPNPAESHFEIEWMTVDLPQSSAYTGNQQATAA